ncbi:MAG: hypothetical protein ABI724_13420 [Betaproteobacteria bacterium]
MPYQPFVTTASLTTAIAEERAATRAPVTNPSSHARRARRELVLLGVVVALIAAAVVVARSRLYSAGSDLGYWLGVAGGVGMLTLFLYPLRKRWRAMREFGSTRFWFALHMTLGIAGPLLIILHSTLAFGSLNATVAFVSMALVATSGIVGRFLYGRIHHGLYGRRATLAELRLQAGMDSAAVHSKLAFARPVEERLTEFARIAEAAGQAGLERPLQFMALGLRARAARRWCVGEATRSMRGVAKAEAWPAEVLAGRIASRSALIAAHLRAVQRVAQFGVFVRLFSWWHVLHVPLVYMMVLSAIAHVVAVHMY